MTVFAENSALRSAIEGLESTVSLLEAGADEASTPSEEVLDLVHRLELVVHYFELTSGYVSNTPRPPDQLETLIARLFVAQRIIESSLCLHANLREGTSPDDQLASLAEYFSEMA